MKIHYFQRYHQKENVATANTMLLLSRLYSHSPDKFFNFLKSEIFESENFQPEIKFNIQEKNKDSVPDATITQTGFKVIVETKTSDWFDADQLERHLKSFSNEPYKVLITLAPVHMEKDKIDEVAKIIEQYNESNSTRVYHINKTFEELADGIEAVIDEDRDFDMKNILDDYRDYITEAGLIDHSDTIIEVALASKSFDFSMSNNLYYVTADRPLNPNGYIGLYNDKSVRAIGKITSIAVVKKNDSGINVSFEQGEPSDELKKKAEEALADHGLNDLHSDGEEISVRCFFVDRFYPTDFKKATKGAPRGKRVFDLKNYLTDEELTDTERIAESLKSKTWQ